MNRNFLIAFIFLSWMFAVSGLFAQQKVTVYDEYTGFPIHDVQVFIVCSNDQFEISQDHFTNKKGRFSTDLLNNMTCLYGFAHQNYITKRISSDSLYKMNFKDY